MNELFERLEARHPVAVPFAVALPTVLLLLVVLYVLAR